MPTPAQQFARELAETQRRLRAVERGSQMSRRSIEGGGVKVYDVDGVYRGTVGLQSDGTTAFTTANDPVPPMPSAAILEPVAGGLLVTWDGTYADGAPAPQAPITIEVHAGIGVYTPYDATLRATLTSAGSVTVSLPASAYSVVLVAVTTGGSRSAASIPAIETPAAAPTDAAVAAAQAAADAANAKALEAAGIAAGKGRVYYQTTAPTGDANSLWIDTANGANTPKQWNGSAWVVITDKAATDAAAAAAAAQTAANNAKAAADAAQRTADAAQAAAAQAQADATAGRAAASDAAAKAIAAMDAATGALTSANGKNVITWATSAPPGSGTTVGDLWFQRDTTTGAVLAQFEWTGSTGGWKQRQLTDAVIANLNVGKLVTGQLNVGVELIAGDPTGEHARLSSTGFRAFQPNPDGGVQQTIGIGTGDDAIALADPTNGQTTVAITPDGSASFRQVSVAGTDADGDGVPEAGFSVYGRDFTDWIGDAARGLAASAFYGSAANGVFASGITTPFGLGEVSFTNNPDRQYLLIFTGLHFGSTVAGDRVLITLRGTTDGSTPTISNGSVYGSSFLHIPAVNQAYTAAPIIINGTFAATVATARILVVVQRFSGTGTVTAYTYAGTDAYANPFRLFPIDIGPNIPDTYIPNDGGGVRAGGTPQAAAKKIYTSTWGSTFSGAYFGSGALRTDTTDLMQGFTSYYTVAGTEKSITGFMGGASYGEVGKTITTALAGASISKVEVALHCNHSNAISGGTARIGYHGNTSVPGTAPASQYEAFGSAFFQRGQTRWITLPSSTHASWANGTYRGITVGPGGDYMRFDGVGSARPALRITYTR